LDLLFLKDSCANRFSIVANLSSTTEFCIKIARVFSSVSELTALTEKAGGVVGVIVLAMRLMRSQSCNKESNEPFSEANPVSKVCTVG
jgi:hypothetical protein